MPYVKDPLTITHIDVDLGDTALTVEEHPDGLFVLDVPVDPRQSLVLSPEAMQTLVCAFDQLGKVKGWI